MGAPFREGVPSSELSLGGVPDGSTSEKNELQLTVRVDAGPRQDPCGKAGSLIISLSSANLSAYESASIALYKKSMLTLKALYNLTRPDKISLPSGSSPVSKNVPVA